MCGQPAEAWGVARHPVEVEPRILKDTQRKDPLGAMGREPLPESLLSTRVASLLEGAGGTERGCRVKSQWPV